MTTSLDLRSGHPVTSSKFASFLNVENIKLFLGSFEHSIDDKGRLAIPAKYRSAVCGDSLEGSLILTNFGQCLTAYPLEEWQKLELKICNLPQFNPQVVAFQRYLISGASECSIDKSGRILIPPNLRLQARLEKDCTILGQIRKFEIWPTDVWRDEFQRINSDIGLITEKMSSFGIQL